MRTDEQKKASRNNGTKSKGPVTPEGKEASARNGNRHNLAAGHLVLLSTEDPYEHVRHREAYLNRFQPADDVELDLVNKMIAASWREQRMATMEASLLEVEMERQRAELDQEFELIDGRTRQTLALLGTADKQAAANLLLRYQSAARRAFTSAFKALRELQGDRFNRQPAVAPHQHCHSEAPAPLPSEAEPQEPQPVVEARERPLVVILRRPETTKLPSEPEPAELKPTELKLTEPEPEPLTLYAALHRASAA